MTPLQHVHLCEQLRSRMTLAICWAVKQPANNASLSLLVLTGARTQTFAKRIRNNNNNNNRIQRHYSRFFTISSQRRELSPTRALKWPRRNRVQITCNTSSAYHVQHVVLRATWYGGTAQLLSLTELKSHLFELYFIG